MLKSEIKLLKNSLYGNIVTNDLFFDENFNSISFKIGGRDITFFKVEAIYHEYPEEGYRQGVLVHDSSDNNRNGDFILFDESLPCNIEDAVSLLDLDGISYFETMQTVHYLARKLISPFTINFYLLFYRSRIFDSPTCCAENQFIKAIDHFYQFYDYGKITYNIKQYVTSKLLSYCTECNCLESIYSPAFGYKRSRRYNS